MTVRHDFTESEWQLLQDAPYWVYFALVSAEAGAQEDEEQEEEIGAFSAALERYESDNELVAAVVSAQAGQTKANPRATVEESIQALERARDVLVRKAEPDLAGFRSFLLDVGRRVAEATEETWFSTGDKMSVAEQTILDKVAAALSLPED